MYRKPTKRQQEARARKLEAMRRGKDRARMAREPIAAGSEYVFQKGNYDGRWYENKMHPECFEDMCDGDGEFTPYSNERPAVATKDQ